MRYYIPFLLVFCFLFSTCTKETYVTKSNKVEVCDFGELNNKPLFSRDEFEMAKSSGGPKRVSDKDRDGIADNIDNCPTTSNANQLDTDNDGIGDVCDSTPNGDLIGTKSVILLDFDGYYLNSSMWNYGTSYQCLPSGMLPEEVQNILTNVSVDYSNYNILVTTDENTYLASNPLKRIRIVVTTSSEIYPGVAGVAYVGSMFWGDDTPAFVFSNLLSYTSARIRIAISHESGHSVGLYHQSQYDLNCNLLYTYKPCDNTTNTGPIMGSVSPTCQPLWWVGPTPNGCNYIQNDNSVLTSQLGLK